MCTLYISSAQERITLWQELVSPTGGLQTDYKWRSEYEAKIDTSNPEGRIISEIERLEFKLLKTHLPHIDSLTNPCPSSNETGMRPRELLDGWT